MPPLGRIVRDAVARGLRRLRASFSRLGPRSLGDAGEAWAARYLRGQGLEILARNFRLRAGEIDLIARDGDRIVFVEVKTLRRSDPSIALGRIDPRKRRRIEGAASLYLARHARGSETPHRFDLVIVLGDPRGEGVRDVRWYRDAF
ncbi:MAG: YraN family protein [Planctomycetes bacterium]|nr:YraN family protein [Planctomycetota bacterium]